MICFVTATLVFRRKRERIVRGGWGEVGIGLFSQEKSNRARGNHLKLWQGKFRLDIRKNFFTGRVINLWRRSLSTVVESPSLKGLKGCADVSPGDTVSWWPWQCWVNSMTLESFQSFPTGKIPGFSGICLTQPLFQCLCLCVSQTTPSGQA